MDKGICTFPQSICPKMNLTVELEFEFIYYDIIVPHISHNTAGIPSNQSKRRKNSKFKPALLHLEIELVVEELDKFIQK